MHNATVDRSVLSDPSWRHWAATIPLLAVHELCGSHAALDVAVALCLAMGGWYWLQLRKVRPYPVQVRIAYSGLLIAGALPGMGWIHWVQLAGTSAMVAVGYCPLVRMLNLLPYNRDEPLSRVLVRRTFLQDPCAGGLIRWSARAGAGAAACCSLHAAREAASCSRPVRTVPHPEAAYAQVY